MTPADPRVRAFLDALADAVAIVVLRELRAAAPNTTTRALAGETRAVERAGENDGKLSTGN